MCGAHSHSGGTLYSSRAGEERLCNIARKAPDESGSGGALVHLHGLANYKGGWHVSTAVSPQGRGKVLNEYPTSQIYQGFHFLYFSELLEFSKWACITFICRKDWSKFLFYRVIVSFLKRKNDRGEKGREIEIIWESQPKRMQGPWGVRSRCNCVSGSYSRGQVASRPGCSLLQPQSTSTWRMEWSQPSNSHLSVLISHISRAQSKMVLLNLIFDTMKNPLHH